VKNQSLHSAVKSTVKMVILESKKNETASKMAKFCPDCSHFEIPPPKKNSLVG